MFGRQTSNPSTSTTKPSTGTMAPSTARSRASSTATSTAAKTPVVTKPGLASKRNSLDPKVLSSAPKPLLIKTTSFSATSTPTVRSPVTTKPSTKLPTQPSTPISGTRSARTSISSRDQLTKTSEPVKRTAPAPSKPTTARSTAPSTPTRDTTRVSRSGSISTQSARTTAPTTASSTKPDSTNDAKDPIRRSSVGATPSRVGPPVKARASTIRSSAAPSSKTQTPASSSPPTPRVFSRPSSMSLTSKDLSSLRKAKTHTSTASLTSTIPFSSPRSSFSSSPYKSLARGPATSQTVSSVPEPVLSGPPGVRRASEVETNEFKEVSVENEATPQIIPTQESGDTPKLTLLSPPLDKDENNGNISDVAKAQIDDNVELEDKEQQNHQHQHQVLSTPPPSRTHESPQSPLTPTPTLQLFKEGGTEAVMSICEQQQQEEESQPLQKTATQINFTTMIRNFELSMDGAIETLYAPEAAPLDAIKLVKESEISTVAKTKLSALDDEVEVMVETMVETNGIAVVESVKETLISLPSAIKGIEQQEALKPEQDQDQGKGRGEEEDEEEGSKAIEEVVGTEEESLAVEGESLVVEGKSLEKSLEVEEKSLEIEEGQVVEAEEENEDVEIAEEDSVLVVEAKEDKQEREDAELIVQDDDVAIKEEAISDAAVLNESEAIETVKEPLPIETQSEDQQLQVEEVKLIEMIDEESVELEAPEELEPKDAEAPVEQEQTPTQLEAVETVELEGVPLGSVAGETVDSVVPILDEEIKEVCHSEEVATPEVLEAISVEQVESTETPLVDASALLTVSEAVTVEVQAVNVEEIAIVDKDIQDIEAAAQEEATSLVSESELALKVVKSAEVIEVAPVDEHEVFESHIAAIEEEIAIESIDEDIEDTETDQSYIEIEGPSSEEDSESEIAEMIVDEQIEIQESTKDAFYEIEEASEGTTEPESSKIEINEVVLRLGETVASLEVLIIGSSFEEETEAEKVVEKDEVPSKSTFLETEASLEVSETDAGSAEEIPLVVDHIDPTCVSHKFVWNHSGQSVKVTGTFDNWKASVDLKKNDDAFEATVDLDRSKVIHFKFVVDGQWLCASDLVTELDHIGNKNHVLHALV
ncbi:hypothetical protein BG006_004525 [Podila minutissima]|uniref:AMP-activated protein kinase glycogen-binding domain-containing protein n=1 Tax=Podila minutissima TaxID=64525 RepID=A0A9P5SQP2_9FUNG|nr:hypothetical protein BG006_004525 [Podila minutissima]